MAVRLDWLPSIPKDEPAVISLTLILMFLAYLFSVLFCVRPGPDCNLNLLWHGVPFALDSNVECSSGMSHTEPTNFDSIYCYGHCAGSLYRRRYDLFTPSAGYVGKHVCVYNNLSRSSQCRCSLGEQMHIDLMANSLHQRAIRATHYFLLVLVFLSLLYLQLSLE